jgi:hypothetical protein
MVFSLGIVNEDWGWVKSRQGHPAGSSEAAIRWAVSGARRLGAGGRGWRMVSRQHRDAGSLWPPMEREDRLPGKAGLGERLVAQDASQTGGPPGGPALGDREARGRR